MTSQVLAVKLLLESREIKSCSVLSLKNTPKCLCQGISATGVGLFRSSEHKHCPCEGQRLKLFEIQ